MATTITSADPAKVRDLFERHDYLFDETFGSGSGDWFVGPKADRLVEVMTNGITVLHAYRVDWPERIGEPIEMNDTSTCVAGQVVGIIDETSTGWYTVLTHLVICPECYSTNVTETP